jgi:hypothetical protein
MWQQLMNAKKNPFKFIHFVFTCHQAILVSLLSLNFVLKSKVFSNSFHSNWNENGKIIPHLLSGNQWQTVAVALSRTAVTAKENVKEKKIVNSI